MSPPSTAQPDSPYLESHKFTTIPQARKIIDAQIDRLTTGTSRAQYLSFTPVTQDTLNKIDEGRWNGQRTIPKCTRLTYHPASLEMVVKLLPLPSLECVHHLLEFQILLQTREKGEKLWPTGGATYKKSNGESREGDASYQPFARAGRGWPSMVVEVGLRENVERVRRDAVWWFRGDEGEGGVSVVLVVILDVEERKMVVEMWERTPTVEGRRVTRRVTRSIARGAVKTQEVSAAKDGVDEGELVVGFEKVVGRRECNGEVERGIVISAGEVKEWAEIVFPE
ncbi:hypothetical protein O988_00556 [Pseudogymnoascus sp. VKM F-3808]|nr:hypothetical protein O988_00556 [Pseudogymnoascus sp. VKM F-3808]